MSATDQPHSRECGADVAAYALGALDPAEVEAFGAHLERCVVCRDELAAFQHVVDVLPLSATPHPAPKHLRRRVLDAVAHEPRLEPRSQRRPRSEPRLRWLSMPRPALALGAAVAVVALVIGGIELGSSGTTTATRVYAAQVTGSGSAQVRVTGNRGELIVRHFSPPPAGKIYEVWLGRPHHPLAPAGALFSVDAKGDGAADVPGNLHGVSQVLVTPEPAGGSPAPTHSPVIRAQLT